MDTNIAPPNAENSQIIDTPAKVAESPVIVAGHGVYDGKVFVIFKDAVSKNKLFKAPAKKTGTRFLVAGITLDEAKTELPLGMKVAGARWGAEKESEFGGLFEIEGL